MTAAERIDLQRSTVARIKALRPERRSAAARIGSAVAKGKRLCSRARVAVRYAYLCRVSLSAAAREFGLSQSTVNEAWHRMYPAVPAWAHRRYVDEDRKATEARDERLARARQILDGAR